MNLGVRNKLAENCCGQGKKTKFWWNLVEPMNYWSWWDESCTYMICEYKDVVVVFFKK